MKRLALLIGIAVVVLTGCGGKDPAHTDASQPKKSDVNTDAPEVIAFPDTFPNIASKCNGRGQRIYVTSDDSAPPVILNDATCSK